MQMKSVEKYRIMGIDPGTNYMGYGVLEIEGRTVRSVVLGDIDLHKLPDPYAKLRYIFERVGALVDEYAPREVALESPFFGENVQSMLKLGRAQGVAMAARSPSTALPSGSMPRTAWPSLCATTSPRPVRSTPRWATNASRGSEAAKKPPRRAARRAGSNS